VPWIDEFVKLDLNSFVLATPFYDRLGIYLHPYAALINHSCNYNAVIGFDGDQLFVKAVKPINTDEQIFVSYVDSTRSSAIRRRELAERYFFDCRCPKCTDEATNDKPFSIASLGAVAESVVNQAVDFMNSNYRDVGPIATVNIINSAVSILRRAPTCLITQQPHAALLNELVVFMFRVGRIHSAFVQAALLYLRVDPVVYPDFHHPIRQIHAWNFAKLGIHISQGVDDCLEDRFPLQRFNLNFGLIIWSVLSRLVNRIEEACIVPSFKNTLRRSFDEVCVEFRRNGLDPARMAKGIEAEWTKLNTVADYALRPE
jgi:SET domain